MATTTVREPRFAGPAAPESKSKTRPITYWAVFGGLTLAFILFIWGKWVTGPYFKSVPYGPDIPPTWMRVVLRGWEFGGLAALALLLYWVLVRPWRRERRVAFDGLMVLTFFFMWFWDPISSITGHWFAYNSYLYNMGSWVNDFPGWRSFGAPGHMLPEPILWVPATYMTVFYAGCVFACWGMRKMQTRWPSWGPGRTLIGCFVLMLFFDLLFEGLVWMPLGFYHAGGYGGPALWPDSYHKFPLGETIVASFLWTGWSALRYFKNDRGETLVERGVTELRISTTKKTVLRMLALIGSMSLVFNVTYNIPMALFVSDHMSPWPKSIQERSYFTDHLCGAQTDRACPGEGLPAGDANDQVHVSPWGKLVVPKGVKLPTGPVPFVARHAPVHPYAGKFLGQTTPVNK